MQDGTAPPELKIARRVTHKHGETFADEWLRTAAGGEDVWAAFADTGLMEWPEDDPNRPLGQIVQDPRQALYHDIEDEILERVFASVRPAVAEEFVKVAGEVLARERLRQEVMPALKILLPLVTRQAGERFARKWRELTEQVREIGTEAFGKADVIEWPDGPDGEVTPEQERFQEIEDEILDQTFAAAMPAVAEAFVNAARAILARERRRQRDA